MFQEELGIIDLYSLYMHESYVVKFRGSNMQYIHMHACIHIYIYVHETKVQPVYAYIYIYTHMYMDTQDTHIYKYVYIYIHVDCIPVARLPTVFWALDHVIKGCRPLQCKGSWVAGTQHAWF